MSEASREARLTQWMLDVGVPPKEVFDLLMPSVGLARTAQVIKLLQPSRRRPRTPGRHAPATRRLNHVSGQEVRYAEH